MKQWHAIRVTYSRELKFQSILEEVGYETFIPMVEKKFDVSGKKFTKVVPAISNLCFVRAEQQELYEFFKSLGEACPARFIWDKSTREPIIVNEKAMQDFIKVSKAMLDDTVYLNDISSKLREGQMVRITTGAFAGVEGRIVRIRKSRRIMVELQGMLAVAATYIPTDELELL
jgi:transcription antitermination factor NusG